MNAPSDDLAAIRNLLEPIRHPETGKSLVASPDSLEVTRHGETFEAVVRIERYSAPLRERLEASCRERLEAGGGSIAGRGTVRVELRSAERPIPRLGQVGITVKSVIAVGSGKGGVGKSTVSVGLAMALQKYGARVGLLDADVYGPSVPTLTGVGGQPRIVDDKIEPLRSEGLPVMSMGLLVPATEAIIWRGPMLHQAVTRFVRDVAWGDLDYLIVDMPPGTGDVAITLSQMLPIQGAVVVCTPQDVALADAIKAVGMLRKVNVPILGVVENMSGFVCPGCSRRYDIFGKGGAREYAEQEGLPLLGELPITMAIRECGDAGAMWKLLDDPQTAPAFLSLARELVAVIASRNAAAPPRPSLPVLG